MQLQLLLPPLKELKNDDLPENIPPLNTWLRLPIADDVMATMQGRHEIVSHENRMKMCASLHPMIVEGWEDYCYRRVLSSH